MNEAADEEADRAALSREDIPIADVKYPAGLPRFFFSYKGSAVVENVGKFIRRQGRAMAIKAWAQRDCQGAIARVRDELYKANLPLKQFYKVKLPKQVQKMWTTKEM